MNPPARYWHVVDQEHIQCDLCPRYCQLQDGQAGVCFVRQRQGSVLTVQGYGQASSFCIDPIEKKPLYHFLPGEAILSLGTIGCNLTCKFCQNWQISKPNAADHPLAQLEKATDGQTVAKAARHMGVPMVAFTYNEPIIFFEYALEVAQACHEQGIRTAAISAGYINAEPRAEFFRHIDAANIDLKSFNETFYHKMVGGHLQTVLETLIYLKQETNVWFEVTTLLIPGENDSEQELQELTAWMVEHLGPEVPLHFSAFHPTWKLLDRPRTPPERLLLARQIALKNGIHYVYIGNIHHHAGASTYCASCGNTLIGRIDWEITDWQLTADGQCNQCHARCAGVFAPHPGRWGAKRLPIRIQ